MPSQVWASAIYYGVNHPWNGLFGNGMALICSLQRALGVHNPNEGLLIKSLHYVTLP